MPGLTSVRANFNRLEASNTLDDSVGVAIWRDWADWVTRSATSSRSALAIYARI